MKGLRVLLGLASAILATATFGVAEAAGKKTLTLGTSADYPPFEFHDTSGGSDRIVGFDIDIANAIARELNFEVKVVDMDFNGLLPALQTARVDFVMAGMTPTPEREKNAKFTKLYYNALNTIISKKAKNYTTGEQLTGKKVGVQLGTTQEKEAKEMKGLEIVSLNRVPEIIQGLKTDRLDAAIIEDTVAKGYAKTNADLVFNLLPSKGPTGSAIAFPKNSTLVQDFDKALDRIKATGELEKLIKKWFEK